MRQLEVDALKLIQETAIASSGAKDKVQIVQVPGSKIGELAAIKPSGEFERFLPATRPPDRRHYLASVAEVGPFVEYATKELSAKPVIWYAPCGVSIVLDDAPESLRADQVGVKFRKTKAMERLEVLAEGETWLGQKAFLRMLRVTFGDCLQEEGEQLLRLLKLVTFKSSNEGYSKAEMGRESIGRDVEHELKAEAGQIPEQITLLVRPLDDPALTVRYPVRCAVEISLPEVTFTLIPTAESLERVLADAMDALCTMLEAQCGGVPIFHGLP